MRARWSRCGVICTCIPSRAARNCRPACICISCLPTRGCRCAWGPTAAAWSSTAARRRRQQRIAVRADIDALRIQDEKPVAYHSRVPQVMHACGHDVHTATVFGAISATRRAGARRRLALAGDVAGHLSAGRGNERRRRGDDSRRRAQGRRRDLRAARRSDAAGRHDRRSARRVHRQLRHDARDRPRSRRTRGPAARVGRSDRRRGPAHQHALPVHSRGRPTARTRSSCRSARFTAGTMPT